MTTPDLAPLRSLVEAVPKLLDDLLIKLGNRMPEAAEYAVIAALPAAQAALERVESIASDRDQLQQWVHDLQADMFINCVYCGHRYGPDDEVPATMADALKEHIERCPKHPISALKARLAQLEEALRDTLEIIRVQAPDLYEALDVARSAVEARMESELNPERTRAVLLSAGWKETNRQLDAATIRIARLEAALAWALDVLRLDDDLIQDKLPEAWKRLNHSIDFAARKKALAALEGRNE